MTETFVLKFSELCCEKSSEMKLVGLSDENFDKTMLRIMNVQEVQVRWKRDDKTKDLGSENSAVARRLF